MPKTATNAVARDVHSNSLPERFKAWVALLDHVERRRMDCTSTSISAIGDYRLEYSTLKFRREREDDELVPLALCVSGNTWFLDENNALVVVPQPRKQVSFSWL